MLIETCNLPQIRQDKFNLSEPIKPLSSQLLKWIGNKQRQAPDIINYFPSNFGTYFEPFLGSGGVLGVLSPANAIASDTFKPLIEIWSQLHASPILLKHWYSDRYELMQDLGKKEAYKKILENYNQKPNGADLLFLCRACYGGVVRFRKADGHMSTPCGVHNPISPESFSTRVDIWFERTKNTKFVHGDFEQIMDQASEGDLIYCDPPYIDSQTILYGAQSFSLKRLFEVIERCKRRGVFVALSIDGTKFSGTKLCDVPIPPGVFEEEAFIKVGRSMLKRFQMDGNSLESHEVTDRLLLTY
ncbi:MAG TPA: Dam family site-specific DNA-(adenine-N6)-methyltransferase [Methylophilaceae bacterium]|nr:Dam family site-specific DNA-(adenine-N6)-methyltransferase [Methylophilaceae bacterium]